MSDFYSRRADLPLLLAMEEPTMPSPRPTAPPEPTEPRRAEILPTAAAVSRKRAGRRERMLERLKCGPATTWELMQLGGSGFSSRLAELRDEGYQIDFVPLGEPGTYVLRGGAMPTVKKTFKAVLDALKEAERIADKDVERERNAQVIKPTLYGHALGKQDGVKLARRLVERLIQ